MQRRRERPVSLSLSNTVKRFNAMLRQAQHDSVLLGLIFSLSLFSSCDFLFGSKKDKTTEDIFKQGAIDPNLVPNQVGYVPLLPF
ncbi:MAG: hypothetical protein WCI97_13430, partial [Bacteroidota bacterium]